MAAIALLLGIFISYAMEGYGTATHIARRAVFVADMYVIGDVIRMGAEVFTSSLADHPVTNPKAVPLRELVVRLRRPRSASDVIDHRCPALISFSTLGRCPR